MGMPDEEKQAVRKNMLTDLGILSVDDEEVATEESFEAMAAEREQLSENNYYESYLYWRSAHDKEVERKREWKAIAVRAAGDAEALKGEVNSLQVELRSMTEQRDRAQKEAKTLRDNLTAADQ